MSETIHINNDIFRRKLIRLVLPIAFQQFMLAIVSASDALMLGKVEQESLAAVSLAGQVTFVQNLFLGAMTIGTSMFAAQYWGKGDRRSVEKVFAYVLKVTAIVSALFFVAGLTIPELLMKIFTNEPVLIERGAQYLRVVALSYLLSGISQIYLCVLKNSEKAVKATNDKFRSCGFECAVKCTSDLWTVWNATDGDCGSSSCDRPCEGGRACMVYRGIYEKRRNPVPDCLLR